MSAAADNRAASALFRLIGGRNEDGGCETRIESQRPGMHRGELVFLATLIPLTALVAVGEALAARFSGVTGWLLAVPTTFLLLNLLPWALCATGEKRQWLLWLVIITAWAWFAGMGSGGVSRWLAAGWLGLAMAEAAAWFLLKLRVCNMLRAGLLVGLHAAAVWIALIWGWPFGVAAGMAIAGACCLVILRPSSQLLGPVTAGTGDREILITIDDGPDPHDTPILLDLLERYQTKAIFFMIGSKVATHPELAREVLERGHEIGNHTMTHPQKSFWCAGPWRTRREIGSCQKIIREATGFTPRWFRAPVGHRNLFTHPIASELELGVMAWNRRGFDAVEKDSRKVLDRILADLGEGDIVLLHEATPIAAEVLEGVLEHLVALRQHDKMVVERSAAPEGRDPNVAVR